MRLAALLVGVLVVGFAVQLAPTSRAEAFVPNIRVNVDTNLDRNVPALAVGWDGTVYAAWQDKSSGHWRIMFAHAPGSGGTFTGHVQVSVPPMIDEIQQSPDIGYWNETVYVVWQESAVMEGDVIMFTSIPMPSGLPDFAKRRVTTPIEGISAYAPSMAVGPNGTIYVAYSENFDDIKLVASYDGGDTWTNHSLVSTGTVNTRSEQRVAVDPYGKVYVTWRDGRSGMIDRPGGVQVEDDDVYIANSTDGGRTFGPNTPVNDVITGKVQSSPSIAIDAHGRLHITWKDERFEPNEGTDIFYAHSDDGTHFSANLPVNDSSPIVMAPSRTTHQQPWIQVDPTGQFIYIAWVDDRSTKHNVYVAKSTDGGMTFLPAKIDTSGANYFIDDVSSYNGILDPGEAAILDNGNDVLDPGILDGSPDRVVNPGRANLQQDLTGDDLRYFDANLNGSWDRDEDIIMSGSRDTYPGVKPNLIAPWDTTGYTLAQISLLYFADLFSMSVGPGKTLALGGFDTDGATTSPFDPAKTGLKTADVISSVRLEITYRANSTYTGTGTVNWSLERGANNSWFAPSDTGDVWTNVSVDLYAQGVTTVPDVRDLNVSFLNNGAGNVSFNRVALNVTKGAVDAYDNADTIVYNGASVTPLDSPLAAFSSLDKIVFVDVNMTGHYMRGEPIIRTSAITGAGGNLQSTDEVLQRADGPSWRTLFNPFPVNGDPPGNSHYMPRIILNPFGYITAIWQDWRRLDGPDIYAATTHTDVVSGPHGPYMAFYMETDQKRAEPGWNVSCSIWVRNIGQIAARAVNVSNVFPAGLEFVSSDPAPDLTIGQQRWWNLSFMSSLGFEKIVIGAKVNVTLPLNTVLRTTGTLRFTDLLGGARPEMYAWMDFITSDMIPPVITHTPPGDMKTRDTVVITGTATDDSGVAVVKLYVKPIGASYFNPPIEQTYIPDGRFAINYSVGQNPGTVEYYIEAADIYGNVAKVPAGAPTESYEIHVTGGWGLDLGSIAVILGVVLLAGVILAVVFFVVLRKRKPKQPEEEEEQQPPFA
jgi:uncharacterized repeat protein (TIGR01451 family)